ncbi:RNA-binding S4 domain-containing protein [Nocardioides sp. CER19]|uniref:RNA-binding S4 domain-containing protein n=1 Tax=Nocardioides sp. CER19 TaxID=3038538 RepID=UPI002447398B|nr:RNA-binding S4 domain-containing protein [Nocardioides sp. CER19]MDH2415323.1 RNA-binding S4 domain-containing protein [Nocardioides sp. CER19]
MEPDDVPIREDMIRLGQFLKLANLVEHGGQAKEVIAAGEVVVNDDVETRRGRQLHVGDVVRLGGQAARVVDEATYEDDLPW